MMTLAQFMGGARKLSIAVDTELNPRLARVWEITASGGAAVRMPDPTRLMSGGPHLVIVNRGVAVLPMKKSGGGAIVSIPVGNLCVVTLFTSVPATEYWGTYFSAWSAA